MIKIKISTKILDVPDVRQATDYTCGVSCMMSILKYYEKYDGNESDLAKEMGATPKDGTTPESILKTAKKYGLKGIAKQKTDLKYLKSCLQKKIPVIINYQAWTNKKNVNWETNYSDGHYSVLIGLDDKNIYLEDPSLFDEKGYIPIKEFLRRWHDAGKNKNKYDRLSIAIVGETTPDELK